MVNLISDYIPPFSPLPNIAPFTYKDGETYLSTLEELRTYINNDIVNFVNTNFTSLGDDFTLSVTTLIASINSDLSNLSQITTDNEAIRDNIQTLISVLPPDLSANITAITNGVSAAATSATNAQTSASSAAATLTQINDIKSQVEVIVTNAESTGATAGAAAGATAGAAAGTSAGTSAGAAAGSDAGATSGANSGSTAGANAGSSAAVSTINARIGAVNGIAGLDTNQKLLEVNIPNRLAASNLDAVYKPISGLFKRTGVLNTTTTPTPVAFDSAVILPAALSWSVSSNPSRIITNIAGRYLLSGIWQINSTGSVTLTIRKNGVDFYNYPAVANTAGASKFNVSMGLEMAIGDYIEIVISATDGGYPWQAANGVALDLLSLR